LHLVSAWATANGISLGQVAVDAKSNEITAIPHLLDLLDLKDCVVTIDAAGCQKEIAAQIVAKEADYVLAVKDNQPTLHQEIQAYFQEQFEAAAPDPKLRRHEETTHSHGRTEMRQTLVAPAPPALRASGVWVGLATILMVYRQSVDQVTGKITDEVRYFISSLPARARRLAGAVRQHWGIENRQSDYCSSDTLCVTGLAPYHSCRGPTGAGRMVRSASWPRRHAMPSNDRVCAPPRP
jgi:predicted transposase YbfD/YdcC